jgi:uncharacterized protein (DUF362 family)
MDRRDFIRNVALAGMLVTFPGLIGCGKEEAARDTAVDAAGRAAGEAARAARKDIGLAIARGGNDPKRMVKAAIDAVGGMGEFVSTGDVVVIKPNIGWSRTPEQAANTNPDVVEGLVELCLNAGAKKVKVFDRPCNPAGRTYRMSGIEDAAKRAGADVYYVDERKFKTVSIPDGETLKSWPLYSEAMDADVLINVPILKHHSMARVTMGMKNMMGLMGGNRESIHVHFDQKLADINTVVRPDLVVLDAFRVLTAHGPNSGTAEDVKQAREIIVGSDPISVDAYGAALFGRTAGYELAGADLGYLRIAYEMGLGEIDLAKVEQQLIEVA